MNYIEAIVLGIIQGLTEFLPISSSGHLEIVKALFGNQAEAQESLFLTIALHVATALSTIVVFRKDILEILKGLFSFKWNESASIQF
jgi:undecaprenyl-diphosphatase